jgi:enamine deaminase RidA (YjgF/YER057c/UK114 family)
MTREIDFLNPPELMKPVGFAHGATTRGGRTLYLAGQVAKDRDGKVVGKGDLVAQFRQVCANLKTLVTAAGGSLTDVVKLTIYVIDTPSSSDRASRSVSSTANTLANTTRR